MTDSDYKIHQLLGALSAKVDRLIEDQQEAAKKRETMAEDVATLRNQFDDIVPRVTRAEAAADEYTRIKTMGKGYLAGAVVSGAFAGGSVMIWFQDHIRAFIGMVRS